MNSSPSKIFKFKGLFAVVTAVIFLIAICIFLAISVFIQEKSLGGVVFCLGMGLIFFLLGFIFVLGMADIVISSNSISRELFGKVVKEIIWSDIEKITVFPIRGINAGKGVNGYNILSSSNLNHHNRTKKIYFNNQSGDVSDLISMLNFYVYKYHINIELVSNGAKTLVKSIPE